MEAGSTEEGRPQSSWRHVYVRTGLQLCSVVGPSSKLLCIYVSGLAIILNKQTQLKSMMLFRGCASSFKQALNRKLLWCVVCIQLIELNYITNVL